jgi:hypothetical protein
MGHRHDLIGVRRPIHSFHCLPAHFLTVIALVNAERRLATLSGGGRNSYGTPSGCFDDVVDVLILLLNRLGQASLLISFHRGIGIHIVLDGPWVSDLKVASFTLLNFSHMLLRNHGLMHVTELNAFFRKLTHFIFWI